MDLGGWAEVAAGRSLSGGCLGRSRLLAPEKYFKKFISLYKYFEISYQGEHGFQIVKSVFKWLRETMDSEGEDVREGLFDGRAALQNQHF